MTVEQDIADLQKQINELKGKTDNPFTTTITANPFSTLGERKIEQGSTGSARFRRIPLFPQETAETPLQDTHGNFALMTHFDLIDGFANTIWYWGTTIPSDLAPGSKMKLKYMYSVDSANDAINWTVAVRVVKDNSIERPSLFFESNVSLAAPATVDQMSVRSIDLSPSAEKDDVVFVYIKRQGSLDTNSGKVSLWSAWIEYLAHS